MSASYSFLSPIELVELLDNPEDKAKLAIIDCRDEDRSEGYLHHSIHMPSNAYTPQSYQDLAQTLHSGGYTRAVFHCALSQVRGPKGATRFLTAQRGLGLTMPAVMVLRGGWESFYAVYGNSRKDLMVLE